MPNINDKPEGAEQTNNVVAHFDTIKKFYQVAQNAGFDPSPEMELFFNSLQIYEVLIQAFFSLNKLALFFSRVSCQYLL